MTTSPSNRTRSGLSLVELMISILLLFIVFGCWSAMNNIQAVRKESFRYAAVEKVAGILDALDSTRVTPPKQNTKTERYVIRENGTLEKLPKERRKELLPVFGNDVPVFYQCRFVDSPIPNSVGSKWGSCYWLAVDLYGGDGRSPSVDAEPFVTLTMLVKRK